MEEGNPNINPVVLLKSITLAIKNSSFATQLNSLPVETKLPTSEKSLSEVAGTEPFLPLIMTIMVTQELQVWGNRPKTW